MTISYDNYYEIEGIIPRLIQDYLIIQFSFILSCEVIIVIRKMGCLRF